MLIWDNYFSGIALGAGQANCNKNGIMPVLILLTVYIEQSVSTRRSGKEGTIWLLYIGYTRPGRDCSTCFILYGVSSAVSRAAFIAPPAADPFPLFRRPFAKFAGNRCPRLGAVRAVSTIPWP